jgi:radical SAM protein with 4Fe4S-binding SPASM domain
VRDESFGAIVFNPYTGAERSFGLAEAEVIRELDGRHDLRMIERTLVERRSLSPEQSERIVSATMVDLGNLHAVGDDGEPLRAPADNAAQPVGCAPSSSNVLSAPKSVIWELTKACNLQCVHCLAEAGAKATDGLDLGQALRVVDALEEAKILRLFLSGGEPFVHPGIIRLIERLSESNIAFDVGTNGYDLPEEFFANLDSYRLFLVQVSIDGIDGRHDAFRGRSGAFAAATRTIERLQEAGVDVTISTTATAANFDDIENIIDFSRRMGCTGFKAIGFIAAGRGRTNSSRLKLTRTQHRDLAALLVRKRAELAGVLNVETGTTMSFLLQPSSTTQRCDHGQGQRHVGCAAGTDTLYIGADGTAYPCPFFRTFPLGNCFQAPLRSIWQTAPFLARLRKLTEDDLSKECRSCDHLGVECNGGCRASAYLEHGDLSGMDPSCFKAT